MIYIIMTILNTHFFILFIICVYLSPLSFIIFYYIFFFLLHLVVSFFFFFFLMNPPPPNISPLPPPPPLPFCPGSPPPPPPPPWAPRAAAPPLAAGKCVSRGRPRRRPDLGGEHCLACRRASAPGGGHRVRVGRFVTDVLDA